MNPKYYELHLTFREDIPGGHSWLTFAARCKHLGLTFAVVDKGDRGKELIVTGRHKSLEFLEDKCNAFLYFYEADIKRKKIEAIIYDEHY